MCEKKNREFSDTHITGEKEVRFASISTLRPLSPLQPKKNSKNSEEKSECFPSLLKFQDYGLLVFVALIMKGCEQLKKYLLTKIDPDEPVTPPTTTNLPAGLGFFSEKFNHTE